MVSFLLSGCQPIYRQVDRWQGKRDIRAICKLAEKHSLATSSDQQKFYSAVETTLGFSSVKKGTASLILAPAEQRYDLFVGLAEEDFGLKNYKCPALKKLWASDPKN
jgi:hypothetical protein